jgi:hypothetical protein
LASSRSKPESSAQPYTRAETAFNADLRAVLKAQGLGALHVRETDTPGAYDLLITLDEQGWPPQHMWAELKLMDKPLEPSQRTFWRERHALNEMLLVIRLREDHSVLVRDGQDVKEHLWIGDFQTHDWKGTFKKLLNEFYRDL